MADAFVAIADDATAASWNPAGLVQLEHPEISIVGACNAVFEGFSAPYHAEVDSWHDDSNMSLNFLSVTYPFPFCIAGRNAVAGLYYQHKYDFSRSFRLNYDTASVGLDGAVLNSFTEMDFDQSGALACITPALALELTHRLSLGVALNIWRSTCLSENGWERTQRDRAFSQVLGDFALATTRLHETYTDVSGESFTFGLLWNVTDRWSMGARYDSAWTAKANYRRVATSMQHSFITGIRDPFSILPQVSEESRDIRFPATLALGAACRLNDRLTLSCDVSQTDWNDFWYKGRDGNRISLVNAANLDEIFFAPHFEPTYTVRLGCEYVCVPKHPEETLKHIWSVRGGVFCDQEPASHEPDNFWGLALGVGLLSHHRINIDLAYQLRYGHNVNSDFVRGIDGFNEDVFQHRVLLSSVIYFGPAG